MVETHKRRWLEAVGFLLLAAALFVALALGSYYPEDPSFNTAAAAAQVQNLAGKVGAYLSDLLFTLFGISAFGLPILAFLAAWGLLRGYQFRPWWTQLVGWGLFYFCLCSLLGLLPVRFYAGTVLPGGILGYVTSAWLAAWFNVAGSILVASCGLVLSLYITTSFSIGTVKNLGTSLLNQLASLRSFLPVRRRKVVRPSGAEPSPANETITSPEPEPSESSEVPEEIPIKTLEDTKEEHWEIHLPEVVAPASPQPQEAPVEEQEEEELSRPVYRLPDPSLLNPPPAKNPFDEQELKEIAARIQSKLAEFNVRGTVVQINPGPIVTTFEFEPDRGVKYNRILSLSEDLCLGLRAESVFIERIPGKATVGIEVPNRKRELIALRQVIESEEFRNSQAILLIPLGKDIRGRIRVASLESMPHLLIAGSTGSGKSVLLNSILMATLFRMTPDQVRMILIDPKRLEMGLYEGIPHLLTPVITDPKEATIVLRNTVAEMERRFKLLAAYGVRDIQQFNRLASSSTNGHGRTSTAFLREVPQEPLPYILVLIDELADLMMISRGKVEESITRLAQMARAVGIHLVVATQRPSVDVITGLIKANFPARISFRVATRVDSRTILDQIGAEQLLGKGDMLFLPPGSSRLVRMHGPYVSEEEINRVIAFWKEQAEAQYDEAFLKPPQDEETDEGEETDQIKDPLYEEAVRVVVEMGKASTSILQRRLRLGYGRAARILDMMEREGIIGPPDGSRPREILRVPDWLASSRTTASGSH